jgi:hypothetical protein
MRWRSSATRQAGGAVLWTIVVVALTVAACYSYKALGFYRESVAPAVAEVTKLAGAIKSVLPSITPTRDPDEVAKMLRSTFQISPPDGYVGGFAFTLEVLGRKSTQLVALIPKGVSASEIFDASQHRSDGPHARAGHARSREQRCARVERVLRLQARRDLRVCARARRQGIGAALEETVAGKENALEPGLAGLVASALTGRDRPAIAVPPPLMHKPMLDYGATPLALHSIASQPLCLVERAIGAREGLLYRLVGNVLRYSNRYRQLTDRAGHWQFHRANPLA